MSETRKQWEDEADGHKPSHFDAGQVKNQSEQFPLTSAERWHHTKQFVDTSLPNGCHCISCDHVRKIQLEAIKHGMELAAGVSQKHNPTVLRSRPLSIFPEEVQLELMAEERGEKIAAELIRQQILTAAKEFKL